MEDKDLEKMTKQQLSDKVLELESRIRKLERQFNGTDSGIKNIPCAVQLSNLET